MKTIKRSSTEYLVVRPESNYVYGTNSTLTKKQAQQKLKEHGLLSDLFVISKKQWKKFDDALTMEEIFNAEPGYKLAKFKKFIGLDDEQPTPPQPTT